MSRLHVILPRALTAAATLERRAARLRSLIRGTDGRAMERRAALDRLSGFARDVQKIFERKD